MWLNIKAKWKMFTDGSLLRQWSSKVSGGGACAQLRIFDGGPPSISNQKNFKNTFTYNITNEAASLKLSYYYYTLVTYLLTYLLSSEPSVNILHFALIFSHIRPIVFVF